MAVTSRVLMCAALVAGGAMAADVQLADDGMAVVDGERTFIIGLYERPASDEEAARFADAGFNLLSAGSSKEMLDRCERAGVWGWANTSMSIDLSESAPARVDEIYELVRELAEHPALLVWEVPDEALWNCWYPAIKWRWNEEPALLEERIEALEEGYLKERVAAMLEESVQLRERAKYAASEKMADMAWRDLGEQPPKKGLNVSGAPERMDDRAKGFLMGYELLSDIDPRHPIWMNHAPRNTLEQLARFGNAADIVGCDIYPVPDRGPVRHSDLPEQTCAAVGAYAERMADSAPGKPVWMVLQGFDWGDVAENLDPEEKETLRPPTYEESRFMAFDAIARGARGILYWGTNTVGDEAEFLESLWRVVGELAELQPVLSAPEADINIGVELAPSPGSLARDLVVLPKQAGEELWLIVVNEMTLGQQFTLTGLDTLEGVRYASGEPAHFDAAVESGRLTGRIGPQEALVLEPAADTVE